MRLRRHASLGLVALFLLGAFVGAPLVRQAAATITFSIPNTFGSQSGAIPVSQIDDNFTAIRTALSGLVAATADLPLTRAYTGTQRWAKGADLTCAGALALGSDGNYFVVNGTCTVLSFSTLEAGTLIVLRSGGGATFIHSASLILLGALDYTSISGDMFWFVSDGGGIWRELWRRPVTGADTNATFRGNGTWVSGAGTLVSDSVTRTSGDVTTTSTSPVDLTGASITLTTGAHRVLLGFSATCSNDTSTQTVRVNFGVDGTLLLGSTGVETIIPTAGNPANCSVSAMTSTLTAAAHTFKVHWSVDAGTGTIFGSAARSYHFWAVEQSSP